MKEFRFFPRKKDRKTEEKAVEVKETKKSKKDLDSKKE